MLKRHPYYASGSIIHHPVLKAESQQSSPVLKPWNGLASQAQLEEWLK
jgi:hypothetical protein